MNSEQSSLFAEGRPASPSVLPGSDRAKAMNAGSGARLCALLKSSGPLWCLFENPPGIVSLGLDRILADLEGFGYAAGTFEIPACAVDAPHIRQRVWIVAESIRNGREIGTREPTASGKKDLAHPNGGYASAERLQRSGEHGQQPQDNGAGQLAHDVTVSSDAWDEWEWIECADGKSRRVKPGVRLLAHGVPGRVARLRALGSAVVPQVVERIGRAMMEVERR